MLVVQLRGEADAPLSLHRVQGVGAADPGVVGKDREILHVGASQSAVDEVGVERGGDGGSGRIFGGHAGWVQVLWNG